MTHEANLAKGATAASRVEVAYCVLPSVWHRCDTAVYNIFPPCSDEATHKRDIDLHFLSLTTAHSKMGHSTGRFFAGGGVVRYAETHL